jgi:hypothetical protein
MPDAQAELSGRANANPITEGESTMRVSTDSGAHFVIRFRAVIAERRAEGLRRRKARIALLKILDGICLDRSDEFVREVADLKARIVRLLPPSCDRDAPLPKYRVS